MDVLKVHDLSKVDVLKVQDLYVESTRVKSTRAVKRRAVAVKRTEALVLLKQGKSSEAIQGRDAVKGTES